jgi:hypothetical protein
MPSLKPTSVSQISLVNGSWLIAIDTPRSKETGILSEVLPYPCDIRLSDNELSLGMVPGLNPQGIDICR